MIGLACANAGRCELISNTQIGRAPLRIVGVRGQDVHPALVQHPLRQESRTISEGTGKRPRGNLHPNTCIE